MFSIPDQLATSFGFEKISVGINLGCRRQPRTSSSCRATLRAPIWWTTCWSRRESTPSCTSPHKLTSTNPSPTASSFTTNNIFGTHVLLEACKVTAGQVKRFIHVSTDEVYGESKMDDTVRKFESSSPLLPTNPYSATKAGAEMFVMTYGRSYNLPMITTSGNIVYGPHQFTEELIPKFILSAIQVTTAHRIYGIFLTISSGMPLEFQKSLKEVYVAVIWLDFHVLQLLPITFTSQQNLHCISQSMMKHQQKSDGTLHLPWFNYGYCKRMLVDLLTNRIHRSSQSCMFIIECGVVKEIWGCFKDVFVWCLFFDPHVTTTSIENRRSIKKSSQITTTYLIS